MQPPSFGENRDKRVGIVEYAFVLAFVVVVIIAALVLLVPRVGNVFQTLDGALPAGTPGNLIPTATNSAGICSPNGSNVAAFLDEPGCNAFSGKDH